MTHAKNDFLFPTTWPNLPHQLPQSSWVKTSLLCSEIKEFDLVQILTGQHAYFEDLKEQISGKFQMKDLSATRKIHKMKIHNECKFGSSTSK